MSTCRAVPLTCTTGPPPTWSPTAAPAVAIRTSDGSNTTRPSSTRPVRLSPRSFCHFCTAVAVAEVYSSSTVKPV
jgi:hypothetical protein